MSAHTQARRLNEIESTARKVIAELTEADPSEVEVKVTITEAGAGSRRPRRARRAEGTARNRAAPQSSAPTHRHSRPQ